jgi:hypothetical protein
MEHNSDLNQQYSGFHSFSNHHIFQWRRTSLDWIFTVITSLTDVHRNKFREVSRGIFVARALGLDWAAVHDLDLPAEYFDKAILNERHLIAPA